MFFFRPTVDFVQKTKKKNFVKLHQEESVGAILPRAFLKIHTEIKLALLKSALSASYPDHPLLFPHTLVGQYNLRPLGPASGMMYVFPGMSGRSLESF